MKNFLKKLGFHKMDEMEQYIAFKAQRNAFFFVVFALMCWTFYESYKVQVYHVSLNPFPCLILSAAVIIQSVSQLVMTHNAVKGDEESNETSPLVRIIVWACVTAGVIATGVAAIVLMR